MSLRRSSKNVAYMEEADDSGNVVEGADVTYAASQAASHTKEKPNTGKKKSKTRGSSSPGNGLTDSDSTVHPRREPKLKSSQKDKEKTTSTHRKTVTLAPRPSAKQSKTTPVIQTTSSYRHRDEPSYYGEGVQPMLTPAGSRPRGYTAGQRPASYYGTSSKPPISNAKYHYPPHTAPPATSYPPQSWQPAGLVSHPVAYPPYQRDGYFIPRPQQSLHARFNRPSTAMGHRASTPLGYDDGYANAYPPEDNVRPLRRVSLRRNRQEEEDRARMPPPARPSSARPMSTRSSPFAPPPANPYRSSYFENDALEGDGTFYQDVSPSTPIDYSAAGLTRPRRPSVGAASPVYERGPLMTEVAGRRSRRNSYVGTSAGYEDKMQQAHSYQNEIMGGPTAPLTAESLRKASKTSSRSTRSSGSHDESWRRSATTGTTRSSNEEDVTIRVKGGATLEYGGAKMQCKDGAEINIRPGGGRGGSDQSSYVDADDRRTRVDRSVNRRRAASQAASYSRTTPGYDYSAYYEPTAPVSNHPYHTQAWL